MDTKEEDKNKQHHVENLDLAEARQQLEKATAELEELISRLKFLEQVLKYFETGKEE